MWRGLVWCKSKTLIWKNTSTSQCLICLEGFDNFLFPSPTVSQKSPWMLRRSFMWLENIPFSFFVSEKQKAIHFLWSKQVRMAKGSFQFAISVFQGKQTPLQLHPSSTNPVYLANTELFPSCSWAVSYSFDLTRVSVLNDRLSLVLMHNVRLVWNFHFPISTHQR